MNDGYDLWLSATVRALGPRLGLYLALRRHLEPAQQAELVKALALEPHEQAALALDGWRGVYELRRPENAL